MTEFFEIDFLEAGEKNSGDAIALRYRGDDGQDYIHVVDGGYTKDGGRLIEHIHKYYGNPAFIDNVVLTHPDGDHAAGLKTVLEECGIGALWMNRPWLHAKELLPLFDYDYTENGLVSRLKKEYPHVAELEQIAEDQGIEIKSAFLGDCIGKFVILAPSFERYIELIVASDKTPEPERQAAMEGKIFQRMSAFIEKIWANWGEENLKGDTEGTSSENEMSIVQFAELCDEKILLTGDAGVEALNEAHEYALDLGIELPGISRFHVPHHGSRRNVSSDVLDKWLGPKLSQQSQETSLQAIISANREDSEHPKKAVVRALVHRGAEVFQPNGTLHVRKNAPDRGWSPAIPLEYPNDMEE